MYDAYSCVIIVLVCPGRRLYLLYTHTVSTHDTAWKGKEQNTSGQAAPLRIGPQLIESLISETYLLLGLLKLVDLRRR